MGGPTQAAPKQTIACRRKTEEQNTLGYDDDDDHMYARIVPPTRHISRAPQSPRPFASPIQHTSTQTTKGNENNTDVEKHRDLSTDLSTSTLFIHLTRALRKRRSRQETKKAIFKTISKRRVTRQAWTGVSGSHIRILMFAPHTSSRILPECPRTAEVQNTTVFLYLPRRARTI